jgi:hypothetical protein
MGFFFPFYRFFIDLKKYVYFEFLAFLVFVEITLILILL